MQADPDPILRSPEREAWSDEAAHNSTVLTPLASSSARRAEISHRPASQLRDLCVRRTAQNWGNSKPTSSWPISVVLRSRVETGRSGRILQGLLKMNENTVAQIRTLTEVLEIIQAWDQVILKGMDHPQADYLGDLQWLSVIARYLDGATPEQLVQAWYPDEVPEDYVPRPLQRQAVLEDLQKAVQQAWRFCESSHPGVRETGGRQLENDLVSIDAYLWLLKDEEAIRERRGIFWKPRALSWICERYGFVISGTALTTLESASEKNKGGMRCSAKKRGK